MKNDDKPKKVRKTLYLDEDLADRIEKSAKKLRRAFNSLAVEQLEAANGQ